MCAKLVGTVNSDVLSDSVQAMLEPLTQHDLGLVIIHAYDRKRI